MAYGYDEMDHVSWVEGTIAAAKSMKPSASDKRRAADGRGWYAAPDKLNPFQRRVMTIVGIIGGGVYNAPVEWNSVSWRHPRMLFLTWNSSLSTVDYSDLTTAVLLAHDAAIRLQVAPHMRNLQLGFHERERHVEGMRQSEGHRPLEAAVEAHRKRFPHTHPVHLPEKVPA